MRISIFAGLALSAALIDPPQAAALGGEAQWCRIARAGEGRECMFYTFEQCAASTERLNGGGCYENPWYRGGPTPAGVRADRAKVRQGPQHKPHRNDANR
jgi:hypothetical protein